MLKKLARLASGLVPKARAESRGKRAENSKFKDKSRVDKCYYGIYNGGIMSKAVINFKVDVEVKKASQKLAKELGMPLSTIINSQLKERLILFEQKPFIAILNNHALKGRQEGYRSINITGDMRAIFIVLDKNRVEFVYIGSHSQLYS